MILLLVAFIINNISPVYSVVFYHVQRVLWNYHKIVKSSASVVIPQQYELTMIPKLLVQVIGP